MQKPTNNRIKVREFFIQFKSFKLRCCLDFRERFHFSRNVFFYHQMHPHMKLLSALNRQNTTKMSFKFLIFRIVQSKLIEEKSDNVSAPHFFLNILKGQKERQNITKHEIFQHEMVQTFDIIAPFVCVTHVKGFYLIWFIGIEIGILCVNNAMATSARLRRFCFLLLHLKHRPL